MIRLWSGHCFHHIGAWPTCVEVNDIIVASAYELSGHRAWSSSHCSTIRPWWPFSRCRVTKRFGGDTLLTPAHQTNSGDDGRLLHQRWVVRRWWQNNQLPVHPTVTELHPVFTMYLLIQLGLNNFLNTHHADIIITHHSLCPQWRVLVIITIDTNITTVSTDELIQAVHR
jgi:hypothetical protein